MRFSYSFWKIIISARRFCLFVIIRFVFRCLKLYFVFQLLFVMGFLSNSPAITSFQLQLTNSLSRGRFSQSLFLFSLSFWKFIFSCLSFRALIVRSCFGFYIFVLSYCFSFGSLKLFVVVICTVFTCASFMSYQEITRTCFHIQLSFFSDLFCCRFAICKTMVCFQFDALKSCSFGCVFGCLKRIFKVSIIVLGCSNKSHFVVLGCCFFHPTCG